MKYMGKYSISMFMKIFLMGIMAINVAVLIALPWIVDYYLNRFTFNFLDNTKSILLITLYPSGVLGLLIENELRKIFKSLELMDPFVIANVVSLKRISIFMLGLAAMFCYKIATLNTIMTMVCAFVFVMIAIASYVLAKVFEQAVSYKIDNDLTI